MDYEADRLGFLDRVSREYGDIVRIDDRAWLVNEPRAAQTILTATGREFAGTRDFLHQRSTAAARDDAVTRIAGQLTRTLGDWTSGAGMARLQVLVDRAVRALPVDDFDPTEFARQLSLELVSEVCFGPRAADVREPSRDLLDALLARMNSPWTLPSWLPTRNNRQVRAAHAALSERLAGLVAAPAGCGSSSMVAALSRPDLIPGGLDAAAVARWTTSLLLPAQEPPAGALGWTLYRLLSEPEWLARAEIEALACDPVTADPDSVLDNFRQISAVVYESLRLHPPTWLMVRQARLSSDVLGYRTVAGQLLYVSPWLLHRDPRLYDEPDRFDPDRWLDHDRRRSSLNGFFSYGRGPNRCPGYAINIAFTTIVVAALLRQRQLVDAAAGTITADTRRAMLPAGLRLVLPLRQPVPVPQPVPARQPADGR
ncbi:MAG: cytochrome P450 [Jatrophihabitans sp.]